MDSLKLAFSNLRFLLFKADLIGIRLLISIASLCWGLMWVADSFNGNTFFARKYTSYDLLGHVMNSYWWAGLFLTHFWFSLTGLLLKKTGKLYILLDSILGAMIWTCSSSMILIVFFNAKQYPPAMLVTHMLVSMFTLWSLIRTPYGTRR